MSVRAVVVLSLEIGMRTANSPAPKVVPKIPFAGYVETNRPFRTYDTVGKDVLIPKNQGEKEAKPSKK